MFKPLPQETIGTITEAASRIATTLTVDAALYSRIDAALGAGDWTYLHIKAAGKVEIVKVTDTLGLSRIRVVRGQEGTVREAILAATSVYYARTLSSIYDEVRTQVEPITLTATGVAGVDPVYAPVVTVQTDAKLEITNNGTINDGNYDPCEPYICPGYVFGPFYFTSKLYPYELVEGTRGNVAPAPVKWRISPGSTEMVGGAIATIISGELREILHKYDEWIGGGVSDEDPDGDSTGRGEWVFGSVATAASGTLRTILQTYTRWPAEATFGAVATPVEGTLKRILIQYTHWMDTNNGQSPERVQGGVATIASGTLT